MINFLAAILTQSRKELDLDYITFKDKLKYGQVLVKINSSGICGSQINEINATKGIDKYLPHLLGHEGSGIIIDLGPGVKNLRKDDSVILHWRKGEGIESETPTYYLNRKKINAGWITTFNEYAVVSNNRITRYNPKNLKSKQATLFGCAIPTAFGAINNDVNLQIGDNILILGLGGIGLNLIKAAKLAGAGKIYGIDKDVDKINLSKKIGINAGFKTLKMLNNYLKKNNSLNEFDSVIDTTGNIKLIEKGYELTSELGKMVCIGVPDINKKAKINTLPLHFGKIITGSHGGSINPTYSIPRYINRIKDDKKFLNLQINNNYKLSEINKAIRDFKRGKANRIVLKINT